MKRLRLLFSLIIQGIYCFSQSNLVPNPSFETFSSCPNSISQLDTAIPWFNPTANSPDYFNQCWITGANSADVPLNFWGYESPKTGVAYAGFGAFASSISPDSREYLEVKLLDSLIISKKYCIDFYVSLAGTSIYSIDAIGIYFSKNKITSSTVFNLGFTPQVRNPIGNFLTDTVNWMLISGQYTASGGEQYITIGNFYDDANTGVDTTYPGNISYISYYYIDDISVSVCDNIIPPAETDFFIPNAFSPNGDGANDVFTVRGDLTELNCTIFNRWGEKVAELTKPKEVWDGTINGQAASTGVYFYYLTAKEKDGKEITEKGNLTLLR